MAVGGTVSRSIRPSADPPVASTFPVACCFGSSEARGSRGATNSRLGATEGAVGLFNPALGGGGLSTESAAGRQSPTPELQ